MKTKQQALANPELGDRWGQESTGRELDINFVNNGQVYFTSTTHPMGRMTIEKFRQQVEAEHATYLGNETEAAGE